MAFGHAAYFGLSAYATGLAIEHLVPSTPVGFLAGVVVGTVGGALVGYLLSKLRGIYFALATIAFGQVFYFIAFRWNAVTGGDNGLSFKRLAIDLGFANIDLTSSVVYYYFVLAVFAVCARSWPFCCARRSATRYSPCARTNGAPNSSASR